MKRARHSYSTEDKAAALTLLDFHRGNVKRAARAAGVPRKTLAQWRDGKGVSAEVVSLHYLKRSDLADRIENLLHLLIDAVPGKIEQASLLETVKAAGIFIDKMQLLRGKPTVLALCPMCQRLKAS
jgi:hypothetical protein